MANLLIAGLLLSFTVSIFNYTYQLNGVTRALLGVYKGVAETSVIAYDEEANPISPPYFSKELFKNNVGAYFASALENYVGDNYSLSYAFSPASYPSIATVILDTSIMHSSFKKSATFTITRTDL